MENIKAIVVNGPNGQQEYGIEDAEARENVQEIVEGAPEELNTFKEAFDAFKEGGDALEQITEAQQANAKAIEDEAKRAAAAEAAEAARAEQAEQALGKAIADEATRAEQAEAALGKAIEDEAKRAAAAEAAEAARAEQAEQALGKAIADEATRAEQAEAALGKAIEDEAARATEAENELANAITEKAKVIGEKIAAEIEKIKDGNTIVGQAREIHSRNGKTVQASFLARTTAGSGTIGDGVATLKSVGGKIIKNLVDGTFESGTISVVNGHTYYASAIARNESISFNEKTAAAGNEWSLLSIREKVTSSECVVSLTENKSLVIDLTEMFGAGNEPTQAECDKLFGTMDAMPQGLTFAKPTEFKSTGFNQFNPDNVLEGKGIENGAIVDKVGSNVAVVPCLPCKIGAGENNGYCIHGAFDEGAEKVYLTPLNPIEVEGELYLCELTKDADKGTYIPLIKGYILVEVPTTTNLCVHFLWSEDRCERDSYEPYFESSISLPVIPQMSEWGLAGISSSGTLICDEIDFERGVYVKRIKRVYIDTFRVYPKDNNVYELEFVSTDNINKRSVLCPAYATDKAAGVSVTKPDKCIYPSNISVHNRFYIVDSSIADAASLKEAMKNVPIYVELATPEEYPLTKVDNNYISSDYGVELFDSNIPCNANNLYYMRSLAGETRNFLDRLMAGLGTDDATAVADRILAVVNPVVEPANVEPETPIEE